MIWAACHSPAQDTFSPSASGASEGVPSWESAEKGPRLSAVTTQGFPPPPVLWKTLPHVPSPWHSFRYDLRDACAPPTSRLKKTIRTSCSEGWQAAVGPAREALGNNGLFRPVWRLTHSLSFPHAPVPHCSERAPPALHKLS